MTPNAMDRRLTALESRSTTVTDDAEKNAVEAAYGRIFESLRTALPVIDNTREVRVSEFVVKTVGTLISFIDQISELDARITAGTLTDADNAAFASVSIADEIAANTTAMRVVQSLARLDREN